jgi:hypothetical protein
MLTQNPKPASSIGFHCGLASHAQRDWGKDARLPKKIGAFANLPPIFSILQEYHSNDSFSGIFIIF